jgi:hypothetical protein
MFSMKTHKVISKTIHQQILSLTHEYLLRATWLSPKQPASHWGTIVTKKREGES